MKALSIRQPWAWLILNAGKDIENRAWPTSFRGPVLVHASKGCTRSEYESAAFETTLIWPHTNRPEIGNVTMQRLEKLERGGIIGAVDIIDCVQRSHSPWFCGPWGFVLANPRPLPFKPYRGMLGFFKVPEIADA